jgi:hypothetical protein
MADNNPGGPNGDGDGSEKPSAEKQRIAVAIESLERQLKSARDNPTEYERENHRWAIRTGKGVIGYTMLTIPIAIGAVFASYSAWNSLQTTRAIFKADQRPIIWLTNNVAQPQIIIPPGKDSGQVVWDFQTTNYGKSPALRIRYETYMSIDGGPYLMDYGMAEKGSTVGAPMPPGKLDFDTVISAPGITASEFARLFTVHEGISISDLIHYEDANGGSYETAFCLARLVGGAIEYRRPTENCRNDIK